MRKNNTKLKNTCNSAPVRNVIRLAPIQRKKKLIKIPKIFSSHFEPTGLLGHLGRNWKQQLDNGYVRDTAARKKFTIARTRRRHTILVSADPVREEQSLQFQHGLRDFATRLTANNTRIINVVDVFSRANSPLRIAVPGFRSNFEMAEERQQSVASETREKIARNGRVFSVGNK